MGPVEITQFLTVLAVDRHVSASTQNQALAAILFLYKEVLGCDPGWMDDIVRAKRPERLPVVLTRQEVQALLATLDGVPWVMAMLLYGSGLRTACSAETIRGDSQRYALRIRVGCGGEIETQVVGCATQSRPLPAAETRRIRSAGRLGRAFHSDVEM
jgi:integrase